MTQNLSFLSKSPLGLLCHEIKSNGNSLMDTAVKHRAEQRQQMKAVGRVGRHARSQHRTGQIPVPRRSSSRMVYQWHMPLCTPTQQASDSEGTSLLSPFGYWACGSLILLHALKMPLRTSSHCTNLSCGLSAANGKKNLWCVTEFTLLHSLHARDTEVVIIILDNNNNSNSNSDTLLD